MNANPDNHTPQPHRQLTHEDETWITIKDGCGLTSRQRTTIHGWINAGKLPSRAEGRALLVPKSQLLELHSNTPIKSRETSQPLAPPERSARQNAQLTIPTKRLHAHPLSAEIYGEHHDPRLLASVKEQGIVSPLLVAADGITVVSGGERLWAAKEIGFEEVPVSILPACDEMEIRLKVLEANIARDKTNEQRCREYRAYKEIESALAQTRKGTRTDLVKNFTPGPGESGKARDLAADRVGWSGPTAEKGSQVLHAIEQRSKTENMQVVEEVRNTLNVGSIDAAFKKIKSLGWIPGASDTAKNDHAMPEVRVQASYKRATSAAAKLAEVIRGDEIALFTPEHVRELRKALDPVLKWLDGLDPVEHARAA